jgi:hypothetical protein
MCGIIGVSCKKNGTYNIDKVKYLMHQNISRGKDSTGIFNTIDFVQKKPIDCEDFLLDNDIKWNKDSIFIGHLRQGSSGYKTVAQAHPHLYGDIEKSYLVGVHNGTLRKLYELSKKYSIDNYHTYTDSQLLYHIMFKTKSTKVLSYIEGSAALLFYTNVDPVTKKKGSSKLYVYRKESAGVDERPLYYGMLNDNMYISSIEKSLKIIGCKDIKQFEAGFLHTIEYGKIIDSFKIKNIGIESATTYSSHYNSSTSTHSSSNTIENDNTNLSNSWVYYKCSLYSVSNTGVYSKIKNNIESNKEYFRKHNLFFEHDYAFILLGEYDNTKYGYNNCKIFDYEKKIYIDIGFMYRSSISEITEVFKNNLYTTNRYLKYLILNDLKINQQILVSQKYDLLETNKITKSKDKLIFNFKSNIPKCRIDNFDVESNISIVPIILNKHIYEIFDYDIVKMFNDNQEYVKYTENVNVELVNDITFQNKLFEDVSETLDNDEDKMILSEMEEELTNNQYEFNNLVKSISESYEGLNNYHKSIFPDGTYKGEFIQNNIKNIKNLFVKNIKKMIEDYKKLVS